MAQDSFIIKYNSDSKFNEPLVVDFSPGSLKWMKDSYTGGELQQVHALYRAMLAEWDVLRKDVATMQNAVATLEYKAMPYCAEGEEPSPLAVEVAKTVNDALWRRCDSKPGTWMQNFQQLLGALYHAWLRGVQVHEIMWERDGKLVYPKGYLPVLPQFFGWSYASGEPDRLKLYPDGNNRSGDGVEFKEGKFIVALNNQGPDHPMFNAALNSLVGHFCSARWTMSWLREYAQVYGKPFRLWTVESDEDKRKLESELAAKPVLTDVVAVGEKDRVQMVTGAASGATMPQKVLYDLAEAACHKLILGQTLTSDTSEHGGSLAQAKVHAGVQQDRVLEGGNFNCDILNAQLVPAIVRANYGRTEGIPMPEIRCSVPNAAKNEAQVDYHIKLTKDLGLAIKASDLYERYGIVPPEDGDDVLVGGQLQRAGESAPAAAPAELRRGKPADEGETVYDGEPADDGKGEPAEVDEGEGVEDDRMEAAKAADWRDMEAEDVLNRVYAKWTGPMLKRLKAMVDKGASAADIRKAIKAGRLRPDTAEFARLVAAAMVDGAQDGREA